MGSKADVVAMDEVYKTAREQADREMSKLKDEIEGQKAEQFILGALSKIDYDNAHNKLLRYALLYQYKQSKEYLKGGKSWEEFLDLIGEERRTVYNIFNDLSPLFDEFQGNFSRLSGVPFNKVRYLGKSVRENFSRIDGNCLVFDNEKIPVDADHTDQIEAAIDGMKQAHRAALAEQESTIKAKDRILEKKEQVVTNLEHDVHKLNDQIKSMKWADGEKEFLAQLGRLQTEISTYLFRLDPETIFSEIPITTARMKAAYIETTSFLHRWFTGLHDTSIDLYGHAELDAEWEMGMGAALPDQTGGDPAQGTLADLCNQCKSAHPECDKCCATCLNPCALKQTCRYPEAKA